MASSKSARVVGVETFSDSTRVIDLEMTDPDGPLGFAGGQYVIVDSGLVLPTGRAVKRAYSIVSADAEQRRFQLAVKRLPGGPGSAYLTGLEVGDDVRFSGPWGKLPVAAEAPHGAPLSTLVLATDTGITAALGLVSGAKFEPMLDRTLFLWLTVEGDDFLPEAWVRARIPPRTLGVGVERLPPSDDPARVPFVRARVAEVLTSLQIGQAFVTGDGAVNYALLDDLMARGIPATRDHLESFFNFPKKAPSGAVAV